MCPAGPDRDFLLIGGNVRIPFAATITNRLLTELPVSELDLLRPHLLRVQLVRDQVLIEAGQPAGHVFFIETGLVTLLARTDGMKPRVQVAMIGAEGMVGGLALLDDTSTARAGAVVLMPGGALRIPVSRLRHCIEESAAIREVMMRFVQSLTRQVMDIAVYNASRTVAERCINWLLMAHERMDGDDLPLTHEMLSDLLCVRRSGITVAMAALQESGLIRTSRGRIRVLDRAGLLALATGIAPPSKTPLRSPDDLYVPSPSAVGASPSPPPMLHERREFS